MHGRHIMGWLPLFLAGCLQGAVLNLPKSGAQSQIIVLELDSGAPEAWVLAAGQPLTDRVWPQDAQIHLLSYAESLDALQLPAGRLQFREEAESGRRLPEPLSAHAGEQADGEIVWQGASKAAVEALKQLRVPPFDSNLCASLGGCSMDPMVSVCTLPCPGATPPARPEPPRLSQIEGWQPVKIDGEPWMSLAGPPIYGPVEPAQLQCPPHQIHGLSDDTCRLIRTCPAPGQWPSQYPPGALFVRAGASEGNGSQDLPFPTLESALRFADTAAPIVFEGEFDLGAQIIARPETIVDREIVGICPERSILTTAQRHKLTRGSLQLEALSLVMGGELDLSSPGQQHRLRAINVENAEFAVHYGDLTILDSRLQRTGPGALVAAHGATLRIEGSHFEMDYAMHLYGNAAVVIRDTLLEGTSSVEGHGVSGTNFRSVDISGSVFRGFKGTGVGVSKVPSVRIRDSQILDVQLNGIALYSCSDSGMDCLPAGLGGFAVTATISRTLIRTTGTAVRFADGRAVLDDVVIVNSRNAMLFVATRDAATDIHISRVVARTQSYAGLRFDALEGITKTLTLSDVYVRSTGLLPATTKSAVRVQGFQVQVDRLLIDQAVADGLDVVCGGGKLNDVNIIGTQGVGLRLVPTHPLELSRAAITSPEALLVYPDDRTAIGGAAPCSDAPGNDPRLLAQDITLVGGTGARHGLVKCPGGQAHFDRTLVRDFETGIHIHRGGLSMSDASVEARRFGVSVPARMDISQDLLGVNFDGSGQPVEIRSDRLDPCPQLGALDD